MPLTGEGQPSPRDAIRDWLMRTENNTKYELRVSPKTDDIRDIIALDRGVSHNGATGRASSKHTTANLAESFCLQAPFLTLASIEDNEDRHGNSTGHQRKRRRRSGSGTSYLEPAAAAPVNRRSPGPETRIKRRKTSGRYSDSASDVPSDSDSSSSSSSAGIPEKLVKDYGRRARHKTREDRYESKAIKKAEKKKEKDTKSSSKRKRKRRSGAQFVHHDDTKTISKNRLTLRPAQRLGLFKKGRASSPVRRGLPDLAFSEMNFLSSRREKSKELRKSAEGNQRRAQEKAADTEEEISRFFTARRQNLTETDRDSQPQAPALTKPAHEARSHRKRPAPGESIQRESSYPPVEPPEKPFLGFGSRGLSPVPLVEAHRPPSKAAPLAAPLEGGQPASVRSATYFSWSRSGTQSASPDRQCRKGIVPSREISATPALFNSTISSIEVGKLGQASLHKPRLPDAQREALCKQSPGRRHLGPNELQSSHESRSLRSNPGPSVPSTKGALKPCSNDESSMEHVGDDGDEPSQLEIQDLATKTQNQDDEPSSRHVQRILPLSTQQEDQMQPLNSLLDDCEAALSRIGSKQRDSVSLRQREHLGQLGFNDVNARDRRYSQCNESVPKSGTEESQDAGARNGSWTSPAESALKESDYTVPGNKGVVYSRDGPSGVQAHPDYFARPARQINQVHLQPQSRHYTPTPSLHEVGNPGDCTIRNIKHPANLAYDISQQQSSTAHPTTDPRLHSRDEHLYRTSMGEAKPLRYTDTNHGHWNAYHHPDDPVWTQPEYLYGNIPARVDGPEGHQISLETLEHLPHFDPFSERHVDDAVTRTEFNGAGPDYGYPHLVSASDIQAGQSLWEDESALGDDVLDDEVLDTRDQESQREESHCGRGMDVDVGNDPELEEMPMAAFWRPHRLY